MKSSYLETNPTSRWDLIRIAKKIRQIYQVEGCYFPILDILNELSLKNKLDYLIVEDDSNLFGKDELAYYAFDENLIYVKESVWEEAEKDVGRSRFTLTHEFCHYLLLKVFGFGYKEIEREPQPFRDPEWQANFLAGALLMDYDLTQNYTIEELKNKCCVSEEAAIVHVETYKSMQHKKEKGLQ